MSEVFRKLFGISLKHSYYSDGNGGRDLRLRPTTRTRRLLDGLRIRFRETDMGYLAHYRGSENSGGEIEPLINAASVPDGTRFTFLLELSNPYFYNITDLDLTKEIRSSIFYFDSTAGAKTTTATTPPYTSQIDFPDPVQVDLKRGSFSHVYTLTDSPDTGVLRLFAADGRLAQTYPSVLTEEDNYVAHLELGSLSPGMYTMQRVNNGTNEGAPERFYYDPEVQPGATFGVVDLVKDNAWEKIQAWNALRDPMTNRPHDAAIDYAIQFHHRTAQWVYKVVFKYSEVPSDLSLMRIQEPFVNIPDNRYHQNAATDTFFFKHEGAVQDFGTLKMLEFKSVDDADADKQYPLYQETKNNLNLKLDAVTVYGGLPNPDLKNLKHEVIVYV